MSRVVIRPAEYRGKQGFTIKDGRNSIFVETRKAADQCKAAIQTGEEITMDHLLGIDPLWWDTEAS